MPGYGQYGPVEEVTLERMRLQFETNVFGGLRLTQLVLPAMRAVAPRTHHQRQLGCGTLPAFWAAAPTTQQNSRSKHWRISLRPEVEGFGIDVVNVLPEADRNGI